MYGRRVQKLGNIEWKTCPLALMVQHEPAYLLEMFKRYCAISTFGKNASKCFPIKANTFSLLRKERLGGGELPVTLPSKNNMLLTFKAIFFQYFSMYIFCGMMIIPHTLV